MKKKKISNIRKRFLIFKDLIIYFINYKQFSTQNNNFFEMLNFLISIGNIKKF